MTDPQVEAVAEGLKRAVSAWKELAQQVKGELPEIQITPEGEIWFVYSEPPELAEEEASCRVDAESVDTVIEVLLRAAGLAKK